MDVQFTDYGTIWLAKPLTPTGETWIDEHIPEDTQRWCNNAVVIEPRYVADIAQGMADDGLELSHG